MSTSSNQMHMSSGETWEYYLKEFLNLLPKVSSSSDQRTIFCDACRLFSLSIRGTVTMGEEKEQIEKEYKELSEKYGQNGMGKIATLFAFVVEALELKRQDFLGHIQEKIEATNKHFGAFYTPDSVSAFMSRIVMDGRSIEHGKIVRMNDPSCGAGALLISGVEAFMDAGGRQGDVLVYGEDLDATACAIFYVQASLLGYAAVVTRRDSLSLKVYEGPWYTPCYFAHGMPMRLLAERSRQKAEQMEDLVKSVPAKPIEKKEIIDLQELVQGEFQF